MLREASASTDGRPRLVEPSTLGTSETARFARRDRSTALPRFHTSNVHFASSRSGLAPAATNLFDRDQLVVAASR